MPTPLAPLLLSFLTTSLLLPPLLWALRRWEVMDYPNERSSHRDPVPRGGGFAPAFGGAVALALARPQPLALVVVGAATFAMAGLLEDLRGVPAPTRLSFHLLVAAALIPLLLGAEPFLPRLGPLHVPILLFIPGCILWLAGYTNVFNFMDGINGISSAQVLVAAGTWWVLGRRTGAPFLIQGSAALAGSALGFLPYNFPRARLFLGDTGSYFWGAALAMVPVIGFVSGLPPEALAAPLLIYVVDSGWTFLKRLKRRERILEPHRDHVYQRLVIGGMSHAACTSIVAAFAAACGALGIFTTYSVPGMRIACNGGILVLLTLYLNLPRLRRTK